MKRLLALLFAALTSCHSSAEEPVAANMRALFERSDADHNGVLSPEEQVQALAFVKKTFGDQWAGQVGRMFARAAGADKAITAEHWRQQVEDYVHPANKRTEMIAMRDGKKLATDIWMPRGDGPFPVVLTRTPYGRSSLKADAAAPYAQNGFVYVLQDARGRFDSEGENLPFVGCGWNEHEDGVDTVEWLKKQPWCDGKVGTIGGSAMGITQNFLAGAVPEGLQAQYISVAAASMYSDATYPGDAFRKMDVESWMQGNKFDPLALKLCHDHPSYDDYWRKLDTSTKFPVMNVPAVHIGGWFDMFTQGTIDEFAGRQHQGGKGSRGAQKLIMGPWTHAIGQMPAGELTFPNARVPERYNAARWFDHYLKGADNGVEKEPAVAYYVMGDTATPGAPGNEWRYAGDWPIPAKETPVYFLADSSLTLQKPGSAEAHREYTFDPADPYPTLGGNNLSKPRGPVNEAKLENSRHDGVMFTTSPLDEPVEVTGRVTAKVWVASSAVDTDLSVRICDVYPDGRSMLIVEGMQRLRYRHSPEKPEPLTPGKAEEVTVDCWSTSYIFNKGHRARVTVTSSNYPRFDINPGTGEPWSDAGAKVKQTNTIYCDATHPSRLLLPLVTTAN
jgi:hypothetical protein